MCALGTWFSRVFHGLLVVVVTALAVWFGWLALRKAPSPGETAWALARAVRAERTLFLDQALGQWWAARPEDVAASRPVAGWRAWRPEGLALDWQAVDGAQAGMTREVASFYRTVNSQRLVVLGAPGSGKTVVLSQLVIDLVDDLPARITRDSPVPVFLSLTTCDLDDAETATAEVLAERFGGWLQERLVTDYGLTKREATNLAESGLLLPVLDGLDEMDPTPGPGSVAHTRPRAEAVLRALNAQARPPVVLACRQGDDESATGDTRAGGRLVVQDDVLDDAQHVILLPAEPGLIRTYLTERFAEPSGALREGWRPVADAVGVPGSTAAEVLSSPLYLDLAVTAYTPEPRAPAELLTMSIEEARRHLLAHLVPAVVTSSAVATSRGWTAQRVTSWLTAIAAHQRERAAHGRSESDIDIADLSRISRRRSPRWVPVLFVIAMGVFASAFGRAARTDGVGTAFLLIVLGLSFGLLAWESSAAGAPMAPQDLGRVRTRLGRRHPAGWLVFGLGFGLAFGLVFGLVFGIGYVCWRYAVGSWEVASRERLPRRPEVFTNWAVDVGLLRSSGPFLQFRHRDVQQWFAERSGATSADTLRPQSAPVSTVSDATDALGRARR